MKNDYKDPVQKEYARLAKVYDVKWRFYVEATLKQTLKRIDLRAGECLLDVGCGTGTLLAALEKLNPETHLAGIDPTREMLDIAGRRLSKKVHIGQSWAEELPFADEHFDFVVSCNMFHYIREPLLALKEMMRVLKPTGRLVMTDWCNDYLTCRMLDLFLRIFNKAHFKTYKQSECYQLLLSSGFDGIEIDRYKIDWFWGMMTVTASKKITVSRGK